MQARVRRGNFRYRPNEETEEDWKLRITNEAQDANNNQDVIGTLERCYGSVRLIETIKLFTLEIGIQQTQSTITIRRDDPKESPPDTDIM